MRTLLALIAGLMLALPIRAAEASHAELAGQLAELSLKDLDVSAQIRERLAPMIQKMQDRGMPPEAINEVKAEVTAFVERIASRERMREAIAQALMKNYTRDDMELILAFLQSETGKKFVSKSRTMKKEVATPIIEDLKAQQPVLMERLKEIASKYRN